MNRLEFFDAVFTAVLRRMSLSFVRLFVYIGVQKFAKIKKYTNNVWKVHSRLGHPPRNSVDSQLTTPEMTLKCVEGQLNTNSTTTTFVTEWTGNDVTQENRIETYEFIETYDKILKCLSMVFKLLIHIGNTSMYFNRSA